MPEKYVAHKPEAYGYSPVSTIHSNQTYVKNNKKYNLLGRYSIKAPSSEKCLLVIKAIILLLISGGTAIFSPTVVENLMGRKVITFYLLKKEGTAGKVNRLQSLSSSEESTPKPPLDQAGKDDFEIAKFGSQEHLDRWFDTCRKKYDADSLHKFLYETGEDVIPTQALAVVSGQICLEDLPDPSKLPKERDWSKVRYLHLTCRDEESSISPELVSSIFTQCPNLEHLSLDDCGLGDEPLLTEVSQILKMKGQNLKTLSLESNLIQDANAENPTSLSLGYLSLQKAVRSMPLLEKLDLSDNDLALREQDFTAWVGSSSLNKTLILRDNPQLNETRTSYDFLSDSFNKVIQYSSRIPLTIKRYVNEDSPRLKLVMDNPVEINIYDCKHINSENWSEFFDLNLVLTGFFINLSHLDDAGLNACLEEWSRNKPISLRELTLTDNDITDVGAKALAQFLIANLAGLPSLVKLKLKGNSITEEGREMLREALAKADSELEIDILKIDESEKFKE